MSLFDSGSKGVKFDQIGVTHTGTVQSEPRERQQTKYGTNEPDFYPNGDPKMQILVDLQTEQREDPNDDGTRTLYVASKNMRRAIGQAIRDAGAADLVPGGVLSVTYVGNDPASKNPANPAKMYAAKYTAPASAFADPAAPQPSVQQPVPAAAPVQQGPAQYAAPQAVQQAQQAAQPAPGGLSTDQLTQIGQLRAAGIPDETIATAVKTTVAVLNTIPF